MLFRLQEEGGGSQRIGSGKYLLQKISWWMLYRSPSFSKSAKRWATQFFLNLLADAEFPDDGFVTLGIVSLEVVEQATPLADQHEQAAARAVVLLVRFEVVRQLANAFTNDGDLNLGTPRVSRVRLILVNYGFLLLSG
jgi:hypothetical protein